MLQHDTHSPEEAGKLGSKTGDRGAFEWFVKETHAADTTMNLREAVSALLRPETEKLFSRLSGEKNPALEFESGLLAKGFL